MGVVTASVLVCLLGVTADDAALRVGVAGSPPFVVIVDGEPAGISVDIFAEAAKSLDRRFELVPMQSVADVLDALADRQIDVAVGPISITAKRAARVSFTQPYYRSTLAVLAPARTPSAWSRIKPFLSRAFLVAVGLLLAVLLLVGTLVWVAERRANPQQFPQDPIRGIGNGVWLALVTMTTVGYGDRAPVTLPGRAVTGIWMVISMITASSLTAGLATAFTLTQLPGEVIHTAAQLAGRKIAAVRGTTGEAVARDLGAAVLHAASLEEAIKLVREGAAEGLVFDRPQLAYELRVRPAGDLVLSPVELEPQFYGFATRLDDTLDAKLDVTLLRLRESGRIQELVHAWLRD